MQQKQENLPAPILPNIANATMNRMKREPDESPNPGGADANEMKLTTNTMKDSTMN